MNRAKLQRLVANQRREIRRLIAENAALRLGAGGGYQVGLWLSKPQEHQRDFLPMRRVGTLKVSREETP